MSRTLDWIWRRGLVSTFLTGFFVILPLVITLGIMGWVGSILAGWFGPHSVIGRAFNAVGFAFGVSQWLATVIGWVIVLVGIWFLGLFVKSVAKERAEKAIEATLSRVPVLKSIYGPVSQVVGLVKGTDQSRMASMSVVYCDFGAQHGGGFLALQAGTTAYRFAEQDCYLVYIPTSPVPMSGGIVFVPREKVYPINMDLDSLMQIYFSLGVMATRTVPAKYCVPEK